jgi:hypothetical protein
MRVLLANRFACECIPHVSAPAVTACFTISRFIKDTLLFIAIGSQIVWLRTLQ